MKFRKSQLSLALAATMLLASHSVADDTDIYLGKDGTGGGSAPSNIMLLLDTSGSMTGRVSGEQYSANDPYNDYYRHYSDGADMRKVDAMIKASLDLLSPDEAPPANPGEDPIKPLSNVNIGIAMFEDDTGNIEHPIALVDDHRDTLRQTIIDKVNTRWWTPIVGSYYETIKYYRGMTKTPHSKSVAECLNGNQYISPGFVGGGDCGGDNIIVILSDGSPTKPFPPGSFDNDDEFRAHATANGNAFCGDSGGSRACGVELARFISETDFDTVNDGVQSITTHTIAFGATADAADYLREIAGGSPNGQFFEASDAATLRKVFAEIVGSVAKTPGAFSAPSIPADSSNGLVSGNEVFLNLFKSDKRPIWVVNVKKFGLRTSCADPDNCVPGELLAKRGGNNQVPLLTADNQFDETVADYFTAGDDGDASDVMSGGLGNLIPDYQNRDVYTWVYDNQDAIDFFKIDRQAETTGAGTGPKLAPWLASEYDLCTGLSGGEAAACMTEYVEFVLGKKTGDWPEQPDSENRWTMAEVLHSKIVTVNFGKTANGTPIRKLIFGTNDGALHVHDADTGAEEFTIYVPEAFEDLELIKNYAETTEHAYGLDGEPTVRIRDVNGNGIIEPTGNPDTTDFVHVYIGMRRGGHSYYGFDLTPTGDADNVNMTIVPDLMWTIDGSDNAGTPYSRFGQTWSKPQLTKIKVREGNTKVNKTVLIFGGGYDAENEDGDLSFDPNSHRLGNAIYIVDADSGDLLWWASADANSVTSSASSYNVPDMISGIAADIRMVDTNGDRATDRLYAVDLSGNVWRADLMANLDNSLVAKLASLSTYGGADPAGNHAEERKFFYRPGFVRVQDGTFSGGANGGDVYDIVTVVSGNRANPLSTTVDNRVYAIRDYQIKNRARAGVSANFPACNPNASNCPADAITEAHMLDVNNIIFNVDVNAASPLGDVAEIKSRHGWYFDLGRDGEKGFGETKITAGELTFSSYVPAGPEDSPECGVAVGTSYVYGVDVLTGSPVHYGWDGSGDSASVGDRVLFAGEGPTTPGTTVVTEAGSMDICQTGGDGKCPSTANENAPFRPTFWYQD